MHLREHRAASESARAVVGRAGLPAPRLVEEWSPPRPAAPRELCLFVVVRYSGTTWTKAYRRHFEQFMLKLLIPGLASQRLTDFVPVFEGRDGVEPGSELAAVLTKLGWRNWTVTQHVAERKRSSSPAAPACEIVSQTRVDADDLLGPRYMETIAGLLWSQRIFMRKGPGFCGEWWKGGGCAPWATAATLAHVISVPRVNRVYLFDGGPPRRGDRPPPTVSSAVSPTAFACPARLRPISLKSKAMLSAGVTVALRHDVYDRLSNTPLGTNIESWVHSDVVNIIMGWSAKSRMDIIPKEQAVHMVVSDHLVAAPVTRLSGHFPWFFDPTDYAPCELDKLHGLVGEENTRWLGALQLPNNTLRDACDSNEHAFGILRRNIGLLANSSCADLEARHNAWWNATRRGVKVKQYPWPW